MNRFTFFHSLAIAAMMLPFTGSLVFADPLTVIEEGQPRAEIIIAEKPPRMVNLAAFELQRYLHKITKTRLPIVHEPTGGTPVQIYVGREQLTAYVSDDDGKTWSGGLMIDEREDVTYPDGVQAKDGRIHIIYDHQRTPLGEVLMATFTEEDVRAGEPVSAKIRLRGKVARLPIEQADAQVKP
jgi:hypothetical protein